MTTIRERLLADPRVAEISDERNEDSGIWVYLKGHCNSAMGYPDAHSVESCVHAVHEDTWTECLREMRNVTPCACAGCR